MRNILVYIFTLSSILSFGQNPEENKVENLRKNSFNLAGRRLNFIPQIDNSCNSSGKVVIEVTVDKNGKTLSANARKDSTGDTCLIELAKNYALQTKWKPLETGDQIQTGIITYNFSI